MKITINKEKILKNLKKRKHFIMVMLVVIFLTLMALGAYFAIYPVENQATVKKSQDDLKKMEVTFDQKTLEAIKQEKPPSVLNGTGGLNPFTPFWTLVEGLPFGDGPFAWRAVCKITIGHAGVVIDQGVFF